MIAVLATVLLSCTARPSPDKAVVKEYQDRYTAAATSHDQAVVESTLHFMDQLLAKGDTGIASIPLNKAQLLFRLKRYDEAVAALSQGPTIDKFDLGTLLLRIGRIAEGRKVLTDLLTAQDLLVSDPKLTSEQLANAIGTKVIVMRYLGNDPTQVIDQAVQHGQLSQKQAANLKEGQSASTDDLLKTLWPD
jgi:hypothetical protein